MLLIQNSSQQNVKSTRMTALQLLGNTHPIHSTDAAVEVIITAGKVIRNIWRGRTNSRAVFAVNELCA